MAVQSTLDDGKGIVRGDIFSVKRTVTGIPAGLTISGATLQVSNKITKTITTTNSAGTGHVEDSGSDGTGRLRFDLGSTDTEALTAGTTYDYDIDVTFSNSDKITLERGKVTSVAAVS